VSYSVLSCAFGKPQFSFLWAGRKTALSSYRQAENYLFSRGI
jgi:hypothetical protein